MCFLRCYLFLGCDQGGSVRIPASYCGIVGFKPTHGLVPYTGASSIMPAIDHLGPMTRNVQDCALLLEVMVGNIEKPFNRNNHRNNIFSLKLYLLIGCQCNGYSVWHHMER